MRLCHRLALVLIAVAFVALTAANQILVENQEPDGDFDGDQIFAYTQDFIYNHSTPIDPKRPSTRRTTRRRPTTTTKLPSVAPTSKPSIRPPPPPPPQPPPPNGPDPPKPQSDDDQLVLFAVVGTILGLLVIGLCAGMIFGLTRPRPVILISRGSPTDVLSAPGSAGRVQSRDLPEGGYEDPKAKSVPYHEQGKSLSSAEQRKSHKRNQRKKTPANPYAMPLFSEHKSIDTLSPAAKALAVATTKKSSWRRTSPRRFKSYSR